MLRKGLELEAESDCGNMFWTLEEGGGRDGRVMACCRWDCGVPFAMQCAVCPDPTLDDFRLSQSHDEYISRGQGARSCKAG
jgi:hypothetical protein